MKKVYLTLMALLITSIVFTQSPQAFKYQAIARDEAGNPLSMCKIGLKLSLMQSGDIDLPVYVETHHVHTGVQY